MKTQTKIALVFFTFSISIILFLSGSIYYFTTQYSFDDFYKRLEIRAIVNARMLVDSTEHSSILKEVREIHLAPLANEREYVMEFTPDLVKKGAAAIPGLPQSFFIGIARDGEATHRIGSTFYTGLRHKGQDKEYVVVVSADSYYNDHHLIYLRNIFLIGILVATILTLVISLIFSKMVFNPVKEITRKVKDIGSQNLSVRLPYIGSNDEIAELANTFNGMIDRLQTTFATQQNFINNASHELNTPLTAIIGQAEVALSKERSAAEYIQCLQIILRKAERLEQITRSLLNLAQTGFDGKGLKTERIRADQLAWDVKNTIDIMYPGNKVQLNLSELPENSEELKIRGNGKLLHTCLSNIVSNACKYSNNDIVIITVRSAGTRVWIVVKDYGIGIPQNELQHIYDPFFRCSNAKNFDGYGIGLALTRSIIRLHNGDINIFSGVDAGTTVEISFPIDVAPKQEESSPAAIEEQTK